MRFVDCHSVMWPNERYERRMTGRGSRNDAGFVFQRYIKPQLRIVEYFTDKVVSHSNSTSNHNLAHGSNSYSARYTYDTDA